MVHDRYEVGCEQCHFLASFPKEAEAFEYAQHAQLHAHLACGLVTVFDAMAHRGRPQLWTASGSLRAVREGGR